MTFLKACLNNAAFQQMLRTKQTYEDKKKLISIYAYYEYLIILSNKQFSLISKVY
jgi:hypothetical protein